MMHVDGVDFAFIVPEIDLSDAGLLGGDLDLRGGKRRDGEQVRIIDLNAGNVFVEREDAAGVGRQLQLVAQAADFADDRRGLKLLRTGG